MREPTELEKKLTKMLSSPNPMLPPIPESAIRRDDHFDISAVNAERLRAYETQRARLYGWTDFLTRTRGRMLAPASFAQYVVLLRELANRGELPPLPEFIARPEPDRFAEAQRAIMRLLRPKPAPAPPIPCPPPGRVAVLPRLTTAERWLLAHAAEAAAHGRVRLWDADWNQTATLHPARPPARRWAECIGEGCAWCAWAVDPTPEKLPAFVMPPNPLLPREQAEWVTAEIGGYRVSGPANQPGVRLFEGEALW
ncbi:hypothetical protein [Nocardia abscessus]|uniref:hypothetical protein n=1 Tax=Nocardia abscessus TaxID=120957 RepID=UPI002455B799|nr:hypothetical protein [Nocardia abscessus]